jgi:hypothetical protein
MLLLLVLLQLQEVSSEKSVQAVGGARSLQSVLCGAFFVDRSAPTCTTGSTSGNLYYW